MIPLQNKKNTLSPNSDYPYGDILDDLSNDNGTPVNRNVYADFHQFFAKLFNDSGLTSNNKPDNAVNGFQYFQALWASGNKNLVQHIIIGLLQNNTPNQLIILWGAAITTNIPGTSTINGGAAYYNGQIYIIPFGTIVTTSGQTLVWQIAADTNGGLPIIQLIAGPSGGSGVPGYIGDYTVAINGFPYGAWQKVNSGFPTGVSGTCYYRKNSDGAVEFKGVLNITTSYTNYSTLFTLPSGYRQTDGNDRDFSAGLSSLTVDLAQITVQAPGGNVILEVPSSINGTVTLDGIRFWIS